MISKKNAWISFILILAVSLLLEFAIHRHNQFSIEAIPTFSAVYGFLCCTLIVIFSKLLGIILKRPHDYYSKREKEQP